MAELFSRIAILLFSSLLLSTRVPFPNKISCFVSTCVSSDNSFPSVRQEPSFRPWKGSPFLQQKEGFFSFPPGSWRLGIHLSRDRLPWNYWSFLNYKCLAARGKTLHLCFTCFSPWAFARQYWMGFQPSDLQESALLKLGVNVWILPQRHSSQCAVSWSSLSPSPKIKLLLSIPIPSP